MKHQTKNQKTSTNKKHQTKNQKKFANKKRTAILVASVVLILLLCSGFICYIHNDNPVIAVINGEALYADEFELVIDKNISEIYTYFYQNYGVEDNPDFWTTAYNDERPIDMLKEKTLSECIEIRMQKELAKQEGLLDDTSFASFLTDWENENERRAQAIKKGEMIAGPEKFEVDEYYYVTLNELQSKLKKILETRMPATEQDLESIYEANLNQYKKADSVSVRLIYAPYYSDKRDISKIALDEVKEIMNEIKDRINSGEDFTAIGESCSMETSTELGYEELVFEEESPRSVTMVYSSSIAVARKLQPEQTSDVIEESERFAIVNCTDKADAGYIEYDQIKPQLIEIYKDDIYEKTIGGKVEKANVELNEKNYSRIKVR